MEYHNPTGTSPLVTDSGNDASTAESYGDSTEAHYSTFAILRVRVILLYSLYPIIFCFGIFGNIMAIIIMRRMKSVKTAGKFIRKGDSEQAQAREKAARSVSVTVSVVSIAFLVLTLPGTINYILNHFETTEYGLGYRFAVQYFPFVVCQALYHANSTIHFYLYCLTGRRFREEFIKIMCCGRNRRQRGAPQ
ncbi:hypothetical protein ACOMHN_037785 [Nucella lapillus]